MNALTTTPKALPAIALRAAEVLEQSAHDLRLAHTIGDRWDGTEPEVEAAYNEELSLAAGLKTVAALLDSLASAGGVEVVGALKYARKKPALRALDFGVGISTSERANGWASDPLVRQSDHLAALTKEREVADGLAAALEAVIRVADRKTDEFDQARQALAAHRESRSSK
ncbi:MAG: hypothetical protein WAQ08_15960 [Aquabacterium sp.]|uniref:hypothetical protein n=1 Tax=Aquabacterium sp. TaxID=1872578 RepID=UPI003BAE3E0D